MSDTTTTITKTINKAKAEEPIRLKGKYASIVGKRKRATARIRMYKKGNGIIVINDQKINHYFSQDKVTLIKQPLKLTGNLKTFNFSVWVKGGGPKGQADAIRHGIAKALVEHEKELKLVLKPKGWMTRDARKKERKKPGLKKARRAPQWSKR